MNQTEKRTVVPIFRNVCATSQMVSRVGFGALWPMLPWPPGSSGDVSEKDLMVALGAVRRMHHLLGAKVVFDDHHNASLLTDSVPETVLRIGPRRSETQWFEEIRHEHRIPFEPETGPLPLFLGC